jgi:hypothetical protein
MFKLFGPSYFLIYDQSRFYFYAKNINSCDKILENSVEKKEVLIQYLKEYRIHELVVFDHQLDSTIKFEKCLSLLSIFDFYAWYQKKKELVLKNMNWALGKPLWKDQALFMIGVHSPFLDQIQELCSLEIKVFSYSAELGFFFRKFLEKRQSLSAKTCMISIDAQYQMNIWFFEEKKMLFFRSWEGNHSLHLDRQIKSAIVDTLRYLEKMTDQTGKMVFFMHQRKEAVANMLSMSFPDALFFYDEDLLGGQSGEGEHQSVKENAFDLMLLGQKERFFPLKKMDKNLKNYLKFGNIFSLFRAFLILCGVFLIYQSFNTFLQTQSLKAKVQEREEQLKLLLRQNVNMPLSIPQIQKLKYIEEVCLQQQQRFWDFIEALAPILGSQYLLEKISLTEEKTLISVSAFKGNGSMEEFLHHWDQGLSEYPVQTTAIEHQSSDSDSSDSSENASSLLKEPLLLTCPSVFALPQKESSKR